MQTISIRRTYGRVVGLGLLALATACSGTAGVRTPRASIGAAAPVGVATSTQELVYLAGELSGTELDELRELAPNVRFIVGSSRGEALQHAATAHGVDAHLLTPEFLERAGELRWVQAWSAGVDRYMDMDALVERDDIVFTNMAGVHGPAIADHSFAMLLSLTRDLAAYRAAMAEGRWDRAAGRDMTALHGRTMLVVGLGGIGSEVAKRARGFGMEVLATVRTERPAPDYVDYLGLAGELDTLLPLADVVAICVPLTDETRGLFDAERLARMKPGSYLINIARGRICDTDALLDALESDRLAGACLDVTDPEPLPADHPLWKRRDVVITPHVAGRAEVTGERRWALFAENVRRFGSGETLLNVVDRQAGY